MAACTSIFSAPWRVVLSTIWTASLLVSAQEVVLPIPAETSFESDTGRTEYDADYDTSGECLSVLPADRSENMTIILPGNGQHEQTLKVAWPGRERSAE